LIKGYLRLGAWIGGGVAINRQFAPPTYRSFS
jgi:hypothetical protein